MLCNKALLIVGNPVPSVTKPALCLKVLVGVAGRCSFSIPEQGASRPPARPTAAILCPSLRGRGALWALEEVSHPKLGGVDPGHGGACLPQEVFNFCLPGPKDSHRNSFAKPKSRKSSLKWQKEMTWHCCCWECPGRVPAATLPLTTHVVTLEQRALPQPLHCEQSRVALWEPVSTRNHCRCKLWPKTFFQKH